MERQELLSRINQTGRKLSKGQRRIADYILNHYDKAAFMTAAKLGDKVGVSESTVVRFANVLGYEGYPALQKGLQELIRNRLTSTQRIELGSGKDAPQTIRSVLRADMNNIRTTLEDLDIDTFEKVVDSICQARHIFICGLRSAKILNELLDYYLNFIFDNVRCVSSGTGDVIEQISRIGEGDVFIGISFPRYSNRTLRAMEFAKKEKATVIAITDSMASPVAQAADMALTARSDMATFVDSLVAPMSLLNALIVALGMRNRDSLRVYFDKLENLWNLDNVYIGNEKT